MAYGFSSDSYSYLITMTNVDSLTIFTFYDVNNKMYSSSGVTSEDGKKMFDLLMNSYANNEDINGV